MNANLSRLNRNDTLVWFLRNAIPWVNIWYGTTLLTVVLADVRVSSRRGAVY